MKDEDQPMDAEIWVVSLQQAANEITILLPRGRSLCVLPSCFLGGFFVLFLARPGATFLSALAAPFLGW